MTGWHIPANRKSREDHWTQEETAIALRMKGDGAELQDIAKAVNRTPKSVQHRLKYLRLTPAQMKRRRERLNRNRAAAGASPRTFLDMTVRSSRPAVDVLQLRDQRAAIPPRDLTAAFFGDPKPGYSALCKRGNVPC